METYDEFLRWAQDGGVELNGIAPRSLPGRGIGIVVTKPIKVHTGHTANYSILW